MFEKMADKKTRLCKSLASLQDEMRSSSSQTGHQQFFQQFPKRSFKTVRESFSLESEEKHLEVSPSGSPASTLSPTTPDHFTALQPESPTRGLGRWSKERSSSIATTGSLTQQIGFPRRWKFKPRRFSVDSQFSRQKMLRVYLKDKKVTMIVG